MKIWRQDSNSIYGLKIKAVTLISHFLNDIKEYQCHLNFFWKKNHKRKLANLQSLRNFMLKSSPQVFSKEKCINLIKKKGILNEVRRLSWCFVTPDEHIKFKWPFIKMLIVSPFKQIKLEFDTIGSWQAKKLFLKPASVDKFLKGCNYRQKANEDGGIQSQRIELLNFWMIFHCGPMLSWSGGDIHLSIKNVGGQMLYLAVCPPKECGGQMPNLDSSP